MEEICFWVRREHPEIPELKASRCHREMSVNSNMFAFIVAWEDRSSFTSVPGVFFVLHRTGMYSNKADTSESF